MESIISIKNLYHSYGDFKVHNGLSVEFQKGKVYGILGKNGVGKTTLIKILMGFLQPKCGECFVMGERSFELSAKNRQKIALLFERHLSYDFFNIAQIEKFYSKFYPKWNKDIYYDLVSRLKLPLTHKIANMSEGQRSQVVLGLMLAQNAELIILDDYSMGLDAGYRLLFIDYLKSYLQKTKASVILTSHVINNMDSFVDDILFLQRNEESLFCSLEEFSTNFKKYNLAHSCKNYQESFDFASKLKELKSIKNVEIYENYFEIFSFENIENIQMELQKLGINEKLSKQEMNLEEAFIGYSGRY